MSDGSGASECLVLKDFLLQCGVTLAEMKLVYRVYGQLNGDRSNAILYPTSYGAHHTDLDWLIRPDSILDPDTYCIIAVNTLGNGLSSSPSTDPACGLAEQKFWFSHWDNVHLQHHLVTEVLNIDRLALVYGWSMGAQQAYHWGAIFPECVARIAALCGTARTTPHNSIFLQSLRLALTSDPTWNGSGFDGIPNRGFRTYARIYASWAASQAYYREGLFYSLGYSSLEDYLERAWEAGYRRRDPRNLIAMLDTWLRCDISNNPMFNGDYTAALAAITARTLVMPAETDLYFTPEDCEAEAMAIANATYLPIPSIWGHRAGNPYQNSADEHFIREAVRELLNTEA